MRLSDLIDLEAQLVIDERIDDEVLRARDRAIFTALPFEATKDRHRLLSAWLERLRAQGQSAGLGEIVQAGYRWLTYALVLVGFFSGTAATAALLYYDGRTPVNIGGFLIAVIGVQIFLLMGLVITAVLARWFPELPLISDIKTLLRFCAGVLEPALRRALRHLPAEMVEQGMVARARLRTRARLYRPVERWLLVELTQTLGVAFNIGVLVVCLRLIYFTDLAFGWSTTAEALDADTMYWWVRTLAEPWAAWMPDAVPTRQLVEQSRFSRLQGGFPEGVQAVMVGQWWRFLVAAVLTYGLLPRFSLWALTRGLRASSLSRLRLDTPDIQRVLQRLQTPQVETRAEAPPPPNQAAPAVEIEPALSPSPSSDAVPTQCAVVRWRQVPAAEASLEVAIRATFGYRIEVATEAGGADFDEDEASQRTAAEVSGPVVVVAEAFEAPDKGIRRYLRGLRQAVGIDRPIYVALVGEGTADLLAPPVADDVALWKDRMTLLEDPYLGVQAVENA
ncbi:MAG: DUF2868 domain-containing protein [Myxococcota bacterium]